ncbi:PML-RARA-regulated adapter molecule 1 isoform X2 [Rhinolophus sinicus]|uniref:PML-RARA-regulated adapter molecule 1 isoform X2 n=1 Tax=Rhinolophus sinicus TaxID=89399 RepID=UPI003D7BC9D3
MPFHPMETPAGAGLGLHLVAGGPRPGTRSSLEPRVGPVEQKPLSLPEGSSLSSGPTRPVAHHLPAAMGSHQDFRSLQAKFQASQPETSELPLKSPKPEFKKLLKKFPQPELSEHSKKPPQPEFSVMPRKPPQSEFSDLHKKPPQPEFSAVPKKPLQREFTDLLKKPPQPDFIDLHKKPPQPEFTDLPKKPSKPEFSERFKKPPQLEATPFPRKPPQPEVGEAPQKASQPEPSALAQKSPQPELSNPTSSPTEPKFSTFPRKSWQPEPNEATPKPEFSTFPRKPPQPEFSVLPRKPQQLQVGSLPKKSLPQPEFSEVPQMSPQKPEPSEPHPHSSQPNFSAFPKKTPPPQLSDLLKKPLQPESADLPRTSSEPEVHVFPKRPWQSEFKALSKKPPKPELGGLPRTTSEPEVSLLPRKFLQPEGQGPFRKFSQPEPNALPKKPLQAEFLGDRSRKPPLPGSVSESSLPTAIEGSSPRFRTRQQRSGALTHSGGSRLGLKPRHPPQRRPLPPASSLGPPPAKPPLPPGLRDVESFQRDSAGATALRRTHSAAGIHFQAPQPKDMAQDPDEIYEMYDDVAPSDDSRSSLKGRDQVPPTQQPPRKSQELELRKEKAPQPQLLPTDPKVLKQIRKAEKAEREFRKKFKFEGEIVIHTRMMIDPNAKTRRGGGKHLGIRRGEILEVIEFTNQEEMLCRNTKGKYGYVPRIALLPLETEVYDDVGFWDPLESQPFPRGR